MICFDGTVDVDYGFLHLSTDGSTLPGPDRHGQENGLCGAGVPGQLLMTTATNVGPVRVRLEWYDAEPVLDPSWEDVVEVSFDVPSSSMTLSSFEENHPLRLPRTGPHRVRWCITGMSEAVAIQDDPDQPDYLDDIGPDRYLLQLWPAPAARDRIVRQTSPVAAYWHGVARGADSR